MNHRDIRTGTASFTPFETEFMIWDGTGFKYFQTFTGGLVERHTKKVLSDSTGVKYRIESVLVLPTDSGPQIIQRGDYVCKNSLGQVYACNPEAFGNYHISTDKEFNWDDILQNNSEN